MSVTITKDGEKIPRVDKMICDKLFITVEISPKDHEKVVSHIKELGEFVHYSSRYRTSFKFFMPQNIDSTSSHFDDKTGESHVIIQCDPKAVEWRFLRIELNPSKIFMPEFECLIDSIAPFMDYKDLMLNAFVNRIDFTVDIKNVHIDQLYFYASKISYSNVLTKSGKTIKLGGDSSPSQFCLYDKIAEIKAKNNKKNKSAKQKVPSIEVTRIEFRSRQKKTRLKDYYKLSNPFLRLNVWKFPSSEWCTSSLGKLILRVAKYEGLQSVLLTIKKSERVSFESSIKSFLCEFWKPNEVWKNLPNVISDIIEPSKNHSP